MFRILNAQFLAPGVKRFTIEAPRIARKQKAGQFVILRIHDHGERIPLTISCSDPQKGTIDIIVQSIGKTTYELNALNTGDSIMDVVGPLGKPSDVRRFGTVVVIGGGVGTAIALPTAAAMKQAGNKVISIIGARTKDLLILEDEVRQVSDVTMIVTDDGSYGTKGLVTDALKQLIQNGTPVDEVLAIGPIPMMRAVAETTRGERHTHRRQPEFDHGGRHRHVRRLPGCSRQQERVRLRGRTRVRRAQGGFRSFGVAQPHVPRAGSGIARGLPAGTIGKGKVEGSTGNE